MAGGRAGHPRWQIDARTTREQHCPRTPAADISKRKGRVITRKSCFRSLKWDRGTARMVWGANEKSLKIVLAGPLKSGKSVIANFLADDGENLKPGNYNPTAGVRIRECEKALLPGSSVKVPVEIWDASGDQNFESCWPAVLTDAHGVVLVYNPEKPAQEQEVSLWYDYFVRGAGLDDDQCLLFMHRSQTIQSNARLAPPPKLSRVETLSTTFESGPLIKQKFDSFCRSLLGRKPASSSQPPGMHEQQLRH